MSQFSTGMGTG